MKMRPGMREPESTGGLIALAVAGIGVCCAIPLLLSAGLLGALAGIGLRSWLLLAGGLALVGLAVVRWRSTRRPAPSAPIERPRHDHQL